MGGVFEQQMSSAFPWNLLHSSEVFVSTAVTSGWFEVLQRELIQLISEYACSECKHHRHRHRARSLSRFSRVFLTASAGVRCAYRLGVAQIA